MTTAKVYIIGNEQSSELAYITAKISPSMKVAQLKQIVLKHKIVRDMPSKDNSQLFVASNFGGDAFERCLDMDECPYDIIISAQVYSQADSLRFVFKNPAFHRERADALKVETLAPKGLRNARRFGYCERARRPRSWKSYWFVLLENGLLLQYKTHESSTCEESIELASAEILWGDRNGEDECEVEIKVVQDRWMLRFPSLRAGILWKRDFQSFSHLEDENDIFWGIQCDIEREEVERVDSFEMYLKKTHSVEIFCMNLEREKVFRLFLEGLDASVPIHQLDLLHCVLELRKMSIHDLCFSDILDLIEMAERLGLLKEGTEQFFCTDYEYDTIGASSKMLSLVLLNVVDALNALYFPQFIKSNVFTRFILEKGYSGDAKSTRLNLCNNINEHKFFGSMKERT